MAEKENINVSLLVVLGAVSTMLLIVLVIGLQAWFVSAQLDEQQRKAATASNWELTNLKLRYQENINRYRWVNEHDKIAAVPIERAMQLTLDELRRDKVTQPDRKPAN